LELRYESGSRQQNPKLRKFSIATAHVTCNSPLPLWERGWGRGGERAYKNQSNST
jgi:hypothetical protein